MTGRPALLSGTVGTVACPGWPEPASAFPSSERSPIPRGPAPAAMSSELQVDRREWRVVVQFTWLPMQLWRLA